MIETKHPAEPLGTLDGARCGFGVVIRLDQPVIDPLMIPLPVIVSGVLASGLSQRPFAEEDHSIETFILDRPDESLSVGVQVGRTVGQAYDLDIGILQEIPELFGELGIPVEDQEPFIGERSVEGVGEIPADLHHPRLSWTGRNSSDVDATSRKLDHEEHVERDKTTRSPDLDGEEVGSGEHVPVSLEELAPRRSLAALRGGVDSVLFKRCY